jgi:DHA1 family tetracycline resistance protein-like MFS transporter
MLTITFLLKETRARSGLEHAFHPLKGIHNIQSAIQDVDARPVYLANFLAFLGFSAFTSFSGIYLVSEFGFTEGSIGTYFAIIGVWVMITQLFILRMVTKVYPERKIIYGALLALAAAFFAYPFLTQTWMMYVLVPFIAIPQGLCFANLNALISKSVSKDKQGVALGIGGSLMALAGGIAPMVSGIGSSIVSETLPFFFASFFIFAAWYVLFVVFKRHTV